MRVIYFKISGVLIILLSFVLAWVLMDYQHFVSTPMNVGEEPMRYEVAPGQSLSGIAQDLGRRGVLEKPYLLAWMGRWRGQAHALKAGEYEIKPGTTPSDFLDQMVAGRVVQHSLTLVEGWAFGQMMEAVNAHGKLTHTLEGLDAEAVMARLGKPGEHPEGRFYPDTYYFVRGTTDVQFLKRAYAAMEERLAKEWASRSENLPYDSPYEALIMASIIEKETARPEERDEIAGVFVRRLEKGMRLQTDPTVIYGMGEAYDGNIRRRDLSRNTPYNTYLNRGLPPTPIAMPGAEAIHAALHPAPGDALYFVARGDGSHHFSSTLEEHNEAVIRYQLKGRKRPFSSMPAEESARQEVEPTSP